jgi:hypothetical protein
MKPPRASISGLMTLVAFVAVNCAAVKAITARPSVWNEVFVLGFLPMANLVAIALLPRLRRRPARAGLGGFRMGFVACGGLAAAAFLALSLRFTDYMFLLPQIFFEPHLHLRPGLGLVSSALLVFGGPQLVVAGLGGWLGRRLGRRLDRRALKASYVATGHSAGWSP